MATPKRNPNVPFWAIYLLIDPRVDHPVKRIRYVGWTTRPKYRLKMHKAVARGCKVRGRSHLYAWLRALHRAGCEPIMQIIESGSGDAWLRVEPGWIAFYRRIGAPLVNHSSGGDGCPGVVPNAETRAKLSKASRGRKYGPEFGAAVSARNKGRRHTLQAREKMSANRKGRKFSASHIESMSRSRKAAGVKPPPMTAEQREAAAERMRGPTGQAMLAKARSPAAKAKASATRKANGVSDAQRRAWANRGEKWRQNIANGARSRSRTNEGRSHLAAMTKAAANRSRSNEEKEQRRAAQTGKKRGPYKKRTSALEAEVARLRQTLLDLG
ncbi:MAG: hypothetical protein KGL39_16240 [Patescibacteria group bacterium]|nr:hypothetical protein [Patescibacteria group bacterium]